MADIKKERFLYERIFKKMRFLLYICSGISFMIGIYELVWIGRGSGLAVVLMLLSFIVAILCFSVARLQERK